MAINDWIGFPRDETGWHTRANAWMNEIKDLLNPDDVGTLGAQQSFSANFVGAPLSSSVSFFVPVGDLAYVVFRGALSGAMTTAPVFDLPFTSPDNGALVGRWVAQDISPYTIYDAVGLCFSAGTKIAQRRVDNTGAALSAWSNTVPFTWAAGDTIAYEGWLRIS